MSRLDELKKLAADSGQMLRNLDNLSERFDGRNGLPAFSANAALRRAASTGNRDFESQFKEDRREAFESFTNQPVTRSNLSQKLHESLWGEGSSAGYFNERGRIRPSNG